MIAILPFADNCVHKARGRNNDELLRQGTDHLLSSTGYRLLRKLRCEVAGGVVTITGSVPSFFLKQMAREAVLRLDNVKEVRNFVEVQTAECLQPFEFEKETLQVAREPSVNDTLAGDRA